MLHKEAAALILLNELKKEAALHDLLHMLKYARLDSEDIPSIIGLGGVGGLTGLLSGARGVYNNSPYAVFDKYKEIRSRMPADVPMLGSMGRNYNIKRRHLRSPHARAALRSRQLKTAIPAAILSALLTGGGTALYKHYSDDN